MSSSNHLGVKQTAFGQTPPLKPWSGFKLAESTSALEYMQGQTQVCIQSIIYLDSTQKTVNVKFYIQHTLFANKAGISDLTEHSLGML